MRARVAVPIVIVSLLAAVFIARVATGGPLDPPPGAISSTDAILINQQGAVFPFVIDAPGVYRLTSDLNPPGATTAIEVGADNVTIDLNGFTVRGNGAGTGIQPAVPAGPDAKQVDYLNTRIQNGSLAHWDVGINSSASVSTRVGALAHASLHEVVAYACTSVAAAVGDDAIVTASRFFDSGSGLIIGSRTTVQDCRFSENVNHIFLRDRCAIRRCEFYEGTTGILSSSGSSDSHIVIQNNVFLGVSGGAVAIGGAQKNFIYNNIADDCGATPLTAPNSDIPIAVSASGAGPYDNIAP